MSLPVGLLLWWWQSELGNRKIRRCSLAAHRALVSSSPQQGTWVLSASLHSDTWGLFWTLYRSGM